MILPADHGMKDGMEGKHTLEETVAAVGTTVRNIKYWTRRHRIPTARAGRRIYYDDRGVRLLRLVRELADLGVFHARYIDWILDGILGRATGEADRRELERVLAPFGLARLAAPFGAGEAVSAASPPAARATPEDFEPWR